MKFRPFSTYLKQIVSDRYLSLFTLIWRCDTFLKDAGFTFLFGQGWSPFRQIGAGFSTNTKVDNITSVAMQLDWEDTLSCAYAWRCDSFLKGSVLTFLSCPGQRSHFRQIHLQKALKFLLSSDSLVFYWRLTAHSTLALIYLAFMDYIHISL